MTAVLGVYQSATLDLADLLAESFARVAPDLDVRRPEAVDDPSAVRFAVCWGPAADAFVPYPRIELVAAIAAGVDAILACPSLPDVPVTRVRDPEQARIMAGFVVWNVLWWHRGFGAFRTAQAKGEWRRLPIRSPSKVTVGILGFGLMGQATARALRALGYRVIAQARSRVHADTVEGVTVESGADGLVRVAEASDFLVNLLPLTEETRGILSADILARMPQGSVLVNVGRGGHLDEAALLAALDGGPLAGASLDVFDAEPLPADHPFWTHPRILVTPHDAADAGFDTIAESIAADVRRMVAGQPIEDAVPRDRGY